MLSKGEKESREICNLHRLSFFSRGLSLIVFHSFLLFLSLDSQATRSRHNLKRLS